ncbi:hypothetical protein EPN87_02920 [archaeon]|nr:MAG: hypothetical protein EPN87_02920 [archaeon]
MLYDKVDIIQLGRHFSYVEELGRLAKELWHFKDVKIYRNPYPNSNDSFSLITIIEHVKPDLYSFFITDKKLTHIEMLIDDREGGDPEHQKWMGSPYEIPFGQCFGVGEPDGPIGFMTTYYIKQYRSRNVNRLGLKLGVHELGHMRGIDSDCENPRCILYHRHVNEEMIIDREPEKEIDVLQKTPLRLCGKHQTIS